MQPELSALLLKPSLAEGVVAKLRDEAIRRCTEDGWFWCSFVRTRDEADSDSVKPLPRLEYLRELWRLCDKEQRLVIAKSRQMLVSWLLCAFCVWFAKFHPHKYIVWQTQKGEDAIKMVSMPSGDKGEGYFARMQFIERNQPSWLRTPELSPREASGSLIYPNGSMIEAVAGGANQVRGKTASLIVEDEFAYQEEAKGVYQSVAPLIQKAMRFIAVSTPNGPDNTFAELYHGYKLVQDSAS